MADPIAELVAGLHAGHVPLAWVVRWSAGGGDPVAAAWAASAQPLDMLTLLAGAGCTGAADVLSREFDARDRCDTCFDVVPTGGEYPERESVPSGRDCPRCAAVVRLAVPTPPPLAAVLARLGMYRG